MVPVQLLKGLTTVRCREKERKFLTKRSTSGKLHSSIIEDHIVKNILAAKTDLEEKKKTVSKLSR